jgi:hypothetical protein
MVWVQVTKTCLENLLPQGIYKGLPDVLGAEISIIERDTHRKHGSQTELGSIHNHLGDRHRASYCQLCNEIYLSGQFPDEDE